MLIGWLMEEKTINMKKLLLIILVFVSVQSFGQITKLYAIRGNLDGTKDSFYVRLAQPGIYNSTGNYVAPLVDSLAAIEGAEFPLSFGQFIKCADQIYRNPLAITGVKILVVPINADAGANLALTNHPNSEQPLANSQRSAVKVQSNGYTEVRLTAIVLVGSASVNSPRIYFQYSTDGTNWIGDGTAANISLTTTGAKETSWITLPVGAVGDVYVRVAMNGGNGTEDPALGNVTIQLR
jgi:hypothetical protein